VTIVDLMNMKDEFASILEQQVIATNVEAVLILHRGLYIRDPDNANEKLQKVKRDIGNVMKTTEVTFEFGVRNKEGS
jgi:Holliday junction resolvase RusA-like endonuclease